MTTALGALLAVGILATALWFGIRWIIRSSSKYRATQAVTCPENKSPAVVEVDALHASLTSIVGIPDIRLQDCSRWPIKEECGQECLIDLDIAPENCLVNGVLMHWYRDRKCVYCKHAFAELQWIDHRPALRSADGKLVTWQEVNLGELKNVLETYSPVCWNCYIAQAFRLEHPDLVVLRNR